MPVPKTPNRRATRLGWTLLLVAAFVAGAFPLPAPAPAEARASGPLVPAEGFYVGAYTKHATSDREEKQQEAILDLESRLGRRFHIDHHFYSWEKTFPSESEPWDLANDRIPMISWNGTYTSQIASGAHDGLIVKRADDVRALSKPVFIRWFWEMDGNKKAALAENGPNYVAAWRRIVDIFRQRGTTNAVWVWCPNASAVGDGDAKPFYPGDGYVDWVCGDGYNFAPNRPGDEWRSFGQIFDAFYNAAVKYRKPIMIGEFGALEREPGEKGNWFHDAHDTILSRYPQLAAVVYFNADSTTQGIEYDFRVDTSPESFQGFRYMFTGPAPVPPSATPPSPTPPDPAPPTTATTAPKPVISNPTPKPPRPAAPKPVTSGPTPKPNAPPEPAVVPRTPSPRLVWVLELLRQLDYTHVPLQ